MVRCSFQGIHLLNTVNDVLTLFVSAMSWYCTGTARRCCAPGRGYSSMNRFLSDMGDVSCQGKVTSLPPASLLPMSVDRNATGSPIPRG